MQGFRFVALALLLVSLLHASPAGAQNYLRPASFASLHYPRSTASVIKHIQWNVAKRLRAQFERHGIKYTPEALTLIALKDEGILEMWVKHQGRWLFINDYPILAASGYAGPKLQEGDYQVPEGIYNLTRLNPNSQYHLSIRVDYPNAFDRQVAASEGRRNLGGDIMIHGREKSKGCIAIGDIGIEEIFYLVSKVGLNRSRIIISPYDMRARHRPLADGVKPWIPTLYGQIQTALQSFRR